MKGIVLLLSFLLCGLAPGQPPGPPGPPRADFAERLRDLRRRIERQPAVDVSAQRALQYAKRYADRADSVNRSGHEAEADRMAAAATALLHVAEHQQHLRNGGGPRAPQPQEIKEHLQRVYFRTEQADYFLSAAHDAAAAPLPRWAREFYQVAVRAYDRGEWVAADENAKCAEEVTKALESLAQATSVEENKPPPPPPPPGPPHP